MKRMMIAGALVAILGVAGVAHSAPGNGNGQGNGNSANADSSPGNSGGNGNGNGNGLGRGLLEASAQGNSAAAHAAKEDPLHPSNVGKFNGFLHASPRALANASQSSSIGLIANAYATELGLYLGGDLTRIDAMAAILEQVANKPLTPELITAINDKLAEAELVDPIVYGMSNKTDLSIQIMTAAGLN